MKLSWPFGDSFEYKINYLGAIKYCQIQAIDKKDWKKANVLL